MIFPLSKKPLYKYSYHSICSEDGEYLEDGRTTIFLSTCGENEAEVPKELVDFLKYVKNPGESPGGRKEGHEAGKNEGLKIGRLEGEEHEERTMELVSVLMSQERFEDLKHCLKDRAFREELLEQLGIKGKEKRGSYTED